MAKSEIDRLPYLLKLVLTIIPATGFIFQGINRILRGKFIAGILWIITGGIFGIGWIIDIITMVFSKDIKLLA